MATSIIQTLELKQEINDVTDVVFTDIVQDTDGKYVREFRFFGTPPEGVETLPQVLVVRIKSPDKQKLELTTTNLQM